MIPKLSTNNSNITQSGSDEIQLHDTIKDFKPKYKNIPNVNNLFLYANTTADRTKSLSRYSVQHIKDIFSYPKVLGLISLNEVMSPMISQKSMAIANLFRSESFVDVFDSINCLNLSKIILSQTQMSLNEEKAIIFLNWSKLVKEVIGDTFFTLVIHPELYPHTITYNQIIEVFQQLLSMDEDINAVSSVLKQFYERELKFESLIVSLVNLKAELYMQRFPEKSLETVLRDFKECKNPLSAQALSHIKEYFSVISSLNQTYQSLSATTLIEKINVIKLLPSDLRTNRESVCIIIAIGREFIRRIFGIYPYNTQILALLGLLQHADSFKGKIAQIATGEGKSTVITLLAFYLSITGQTVDIVSSSRYLSSRDQEKYSKFFDIFDISSSHICTDNPTSKNFEGQILYGTNYDFEFAIMRDYLNQHRYRTITINGETKQRPFNSVIIDEVDNLFIDTASNSARIAIPKDYQTSWVYQPILEFVQMYEHSLQNQVYSENILRDLRAVLINFKAGQYLNVLERIDDAQLKKWLNSAYTALYQKQLDIDYVIKLKEGHTSVGIVERDRIVVVDLKNTGRLQEGCRWQNGLHEFLEAKHNLYVEEEYLMPASLSHPVFFQKYEAIYGLTGTTGGTYECQEIEAIYNTECFDVPTYRPNRRTILDPVFVTGKEAFLKQMIQEIHTVQNQKRPILILAESIQETNTLSKILEAKGIFNQILNEVQKDTETFILAKAGNPTAITIATNTAGRGTDIVLHADSIRNGGLHVILTSYPKNQRVETQAIGRAARQGQPGSARFILDLQQQDIVKSSTDIFDEIIYLNSTEKMEKLQSRRNEIIRSDSEVRKEHSKIESINHTYLDPFLDKISSWYQQIDEDYINLKSDLLKDHQNLNPIISNLNTVIDDKKSQQLTNALRHAIEQATINPLAWKSFLAYAKTLLHENLQQTWSICFYNKLDDFLIQTRSLHLSSQSTESFISFYENQLNLFYSTVKDKWELYLKEPKKSFLNYIMNMTEINFG